MPSTEALFDVSWRRDFTLRSRYVSRRSPRRRCPSLTLSLLKSRSYAIRGKFKKIYSKISVIFFSHMKKSNLACLQTFPRFNILEHFAKIRKGENRAKKPTGSENFLSDFEPLQFFRRCSRILESLEIRQQTKLAIFLLSGHLYYISYIYLN